jgi:hypothetical protein
MNFWGQPQTPWLRFVEKVGQCGLLRSRATLFASFSGKRRYLLTRISARPPGSASLRGEGWAVWSSAKQNYAFCFFFWKKKSSTNPTASNQTWSPFGHCESCKVHYIGGFVGILKRRLGILFRGFDKYWAMRQSIEFPFG